MKKLTTTIVLLLILIQGFTQVSDSVSILPGYTNQSYYQLENGEAANVSNQNWDLQIATNAFSASIRTNSGNGVQVFAPVNQDTSMSNWNSLDTAGMVPLYDRDTSWEEAAFLNQALGHPDYGWGVYQGQGTLIGSKIFVVRTKSGDYYKFFIEQLMNGITYTIRFDKLDGTLQRTMIVSKTDHQGKSFFYINMDAGTQLDFEPVDSLWDFVIRKYMAELSPGVYYPVVGVLTNYEVTTAEARGVDLANVSPYDYPYSTEINTIGHDWKDFDMNTFKWIIEDSLAYFIKSRVGNIWKIIFTGYEGSSSGKIKFIKEKMQSVGIEDMKDADVTLMTLYPNPSNGQLNIVFDVVNSADVSIEIYDLTGRQVYRQPVSVGIGLQNIRLPEMDLNTGQYIVIVNDGKNRLAQSWTLLK
jgi:Secretion system C-terminal sorting domain/HmuY protein